MRSVCGENVTTATTIPWRSTSGSRARKSGRTWPHKSAAPASHMPRVCTLTRVWSKSSASSRTPLACIDCATAAESAAKESLEARLNEADRATAAQVTFAADRGGVTLEEGRRAFEALKRRSLERKVRAARREMVEAERSGDRKKAMDLMAERSEIEKRLQAMGPENVEENRKLSLET